MVTILCPCCKPTRNLTPKYLSVENLLTYFYVRAREKHKSVDFGDTRWNKNNCIHHIMLNHPKPVLRAGFESYTLLKMHEDLKENSLLPSLFHFHPSIPRFAWLSRVSVFHWPLGSRKNKLRGKGQEQRTTSNNTEERCADELTAAWPFALIVDVWCRWFTYRCFFFRAETEQVSLTLECGGTVSNLCQVNQEEIKNLALRLLLISCQLPHVNVHIPHT